MIELSHQNNVDGFIYASSSSVYGGNKKINTFFLTKHIQRDTLLIEPEQRVSLWPRNN